MEKHEKWLAQQDMNPNPVKNWSIEELTEAVKKDMTGGVCICGHKIGEPHSHRRNIIPHEIYMVFVIGILFLLFYYLLP